MAIGVEFFNRHPASGAFEVQECKKKKCWLKWSKCIGQLPFTLTRLHIEHLIHIMNIQSKNTNTSIQEHKNWPNNKNNQQPTLRIQRTGRHRWGRRSCRRQVGACSSLWGGPSLSMGGEGHATERDREREVWDRGERPSPPPFIRSRG